MKQFYIFAKTNIASEDTIHLSSATLSNVRCEPVYQHGKDYKREVLVDGKAPDHFTEQDLNKEVSKLLGQYSFSPIKTEFRPANQICEEHTYMKAG